MDEQLIETTGVSNHRTRNIIILTGVGIGLILAIAAVILLDPFGLNLLGRGMEIPAQAMPPEVVFYLGMDLRNLQSEDLDPIVWAFSEDLKQDQVSAIDRMNEELDKLFEDGLGMSFTEDVMPWVGGAIGFGLTDLEMDRYGGPEEVEFILAFEVRDKGAADEFLMKFKDRVAEESGEGFSEETYQAVTIHILDTQYEYEQIAFCRSDGLILFGQYESAFKGAIDAQSGESLADTLNFREVIGSLPPDRIVTMFINGEKYFNTFSDTFSWLYGTDLSDLYSETAGMMLDIAMGLSVADVGIRMDMAYKLDPEAISEETLEGFAVGESRTAQILPETTLLHIYSHRLDLVWQSMIDAISAMEDADFEESMEMFELTFGFDINDDLFAKLDGEWAFALMPSSAGFLSEFLEVPIGFSLLAETSDPDGLLEVSEAFSSNAELQGLGEVEKSQDEWGTYFDLLDMYSGTVIFTYGVGDDLFVIGSSKDVLQSIFSDRPSLSESE
ncbi:MAG TPA: DUF3352 domain-containing protein, partial [Anaerolineae bacterium]|nr:DUF3352 domain-containing protein [Anaerolineae bacterium]